jgi:hypothetical protein
VGMLVMFPHCTPQQLTLDGTWQHTDQHLRFTGIISSTSEGRVCLAGDLPMTFPSGHLFPFAIDTQQQPFISLLALAKGDITSKRNGIWAVKPRVLERVEASWRDILSKTRHGFIRVAQARGGHVAPVPAWQPL